MATFFVLVNPAPARSSKTFSVSWVPAVCGILFVACTSTAFMGGTHSQAIIGAIWQELLGRWHFEAVGPVNLVARKAGHFIGHGMLSLVFRNTWYTVVRRYAPERRGTWLFGAGLLAVLTTMAIASMDELHQMFIPGRVGCPRDVMIDTAGALVANALFVWMKVRSRQQSAFGSRRRLETYSSF